MYKILRHFIAFLWLCFFISCNKGGKDQGRDQGTDTTSVTKKDTFYFGADLSYVNQVMDHNGSYKDGANVASPYKIFSDHGANLVRVRLWHNPSWTKEVYGTSGRQLYSDILDAEKTISLAKAQGMQVMLDLHYSDTWADPEKQVGPKAWAGIRNIDVLADSVYQYTLRTLVYLQGKNLLPEIVQIGNEINCGMFYTDAPAGFPTANACKGDWKKLGSLLQSGIKAVRDVSAFSGIKMKIAFHVADPKNVEWWFDEITKTGISDYDIIGFSFYPLWHTTIKLEQLSDYVSRFKAKYNKKVMVLETAYPWSVSGNDSYTNLFGSQAPVVGYPFTPQGQFEMLKTLTQEVKDGGGSGIIYWEPAWISSSMKDLYGSGSSWENATLFDFTGTTLPGIDYMKFNYK